ncbi:hypothetical protein ACIREM_11680 [Streptomyces shenzhenensis]|uniref:hypothetical protein n=1 Tax=Streptomyces shenzhenensis TaxID=943815 RepID=UPI0038159216
MLDAVVQPDEPVDDRRGRGAVGGADPVQADHLRADSAGDLRDGASHPAGDAEDGGGLALGRPGGLDGTEPAAADGPGPPTWNAPLITPVGSSRE